MLGIIGMATVTLLAGFMAFVVTFGVLERAGFWRRYEIAALIPLVFFSAIAAIGASSLTFWLLL